MNLVPFWFLLRRECHRFTKVLVQTVLTPLVSASLYLLIFGVSLGSQINLDSGSQRYLAFLIPGLMMMGLMNNAFQNSSSSIVSSKFTGDLEDLATVPLTRNNIIWAMSLACVIRGSVVAFMTLLAGEFFYYLQFHELLFIEHPIILAYFMLMAGIVFGQLGLLAAFWAKTFDQLSAISAFLLLPLTYLGGVFMSIENLHPVWQWISKINPLFYFINGLRYGVLGASDVPPLQAGAIVFVAFLLFFGLTHRVLSRVSFSRW